MNEKLTHSDREPFSGDFTWQHCSCTSSHTVDQTASLSIQTVPVPVGITRLADDVILDVNPPFSEMFGLSRHELMGSNFANFYKESVAYQTLLRMLHSAGELHNYEIEAQTATGESVWLSVSLHPIAIDQEAALLWMLHDITQHKRIESEMRSRAQQQATVARLGQKALAGIHPTALMREAVSLIAQTLKVEQCGVLELLPNRHAAQLKAGVGWKKGFVGSATIGAQPNNFIGYTLQSAQPVVIEDLQIETRFSGSPLLHNHRVVSSVNVTIPGQSEPFGVLGVYSSTSRQFTEDDVHFLQAIANLLAMANNRKQSEDRLRLMERAIAASRNGIIITDPTQFDNPTIYANPAFERITGYDIADILGRNCRSLQGADSDPQTIVQLRDAIQQRQECQFVLRNYRKDGTPFWNDLSISPVFDEQGNLINFIGIQSDITEKKQAEEALRQQKEILQTIFDHIPVMVMLYDADGRIQLINRSLENTLGWSLAELKSADFLSKCCVDPADQPRAIAQMMNPSAGWMDFKTRVRNGRILDTAWSTTQLSDGTFVGIGQDITDRKRTEEKLRRERDLLNGIMQTSVTAILVLSAEGQIVFANDRAEEMLGLTTMDLAQRRYNAPEWNITDLQGHPLPDEQLPFHQVLQTGQPVFDIQHAIHNSDGDRRLLSINGAPLKDQMGQVTKVVFSISDITQRKQMEEQLQHDALHDVLTGLPNRALFVDRLTQAIARTRRDTDHQFAVLFLDLDRFKVINDSLGHSVGDQLLITIAQRLRECLRPGDTVARLGGDEFTILLDDIVDVIDATTVAERIHHVLQVPFYLNGYEVFTTASIGITMSAATYNQPDDLLRDADTAMYRAKEQGSACHAIFHSTMYDRVVALLQLETDLRRATERQELWLQYQPIVSLQTGKITGFEALVRWQHSQRGLISPADFIPVAEETGLIVPIGLWVLQEACKQIRRWQMQFPHYANLTLAVNLSAKQLSQPELPEAIDQILAEAALPPGTLKLEITESGIMENAESAAQLLTDLKVRQITICVDDFGTGYSSLSRLHAFPIDTLKVDRSFVSRMNHDSGSAKITQAIITLAHTLGMDVIAEGVETLEDLDRLRQLGCEYAQGYLFSKPLDSQAAEQLLTLPSLQVGDARSSF